MSWTPERTETLKTLWKQGLSAGQIAASLGNVSRNAVCGKIHRLQLPAPKVKLLVKSKKPKRDIAVRASGPDYYKSRSFNPKSHGTPSKPYVARVHKAGPKSTSFDELTATTCRFPLGQITGPGQMFCGVECGLEDIYCKEHHKIAHDPLKSRFPAKVGNPNRPYAPSVKEEF